MKYTEVMETLRAETAVFYRAKPGVASIKKMKVLGRKINKLDLDEDAVISYVDFCYKKLKKIKDTGKRSSVDYFVGILGTEKTFDSFLDFRRTTGELRQEDPTEDDDNDDTLRINGITYNKILSEEDRDIFWSEQEFGMMVRDLSRMIPKIMSLKEYNQIYPDNKVTVNTIKHLIEGGTICLT